MITLAVDDMLSIAQHIRGFMCEIDPEGRHFAYDNAVGMLDLVEKDRPDIVWLNIGMQGMNGLELAEDIKKISPDSNIIFVTEYPEYAIDAFRLHASGFVLKPVTKEKLIHEINNLRHPVKVSEGKRIKVQCFGNFEVFVDGNIMRFKRSLSKEALAYLVDRKGACCTVGAICSVLWEDRQADKKLKSQCRVVMAALKNDLTTLGCEDILVKNWNTWAIDTSKISCDYYDFLKKDSVATDSFRGEYMAQYSWAEITAGNLFNMTGMIPDKE